MLDLSRELEGREDPGWGGLVIPKSWEVVEDPGRGALEFTATYQPIRGHFKILPRYCSEYDVYQLQI